jgi:glucoamylase
MIDSLDLEAWIARQKDRSAMAIQKAISATHLIRRRDAFGQTIVPSKGSVLASPVIANWDPEPDYFFHWLRDSAIVMRTVAELMQDASSASERERWRSHFEDFVRFSLTLSNLNGAAFLSRNDYRRATHPEYRQFLRDEAEIRTLVGDALLGDVRFNPDGTIDILRWSRPQYDGPALRALACLRFLASGGSETDDIKRLLNLDLDFTRRCAGRHCIGPWEEPGENAHHYYVGLVQLAALTHGRAWVSDMTAEWNAAEDTLRANLESHWLESGGYFIARQPASAALAEGMLDAACLLAVWDADLRDGPHSIRDLRVQKTLIAIEKFYRQEFPINHARTEEQGHALGRYRGDRYFGGGAWYPTTLAAAGLYYRLAQCSAQNCRDFVRRGDALMAAVRDLTPADGALSEQLDRATGQQTSARHLTWSYAAFVSTARMRVQALDSALRKENERLSVPGWDRV